MALSTSIKPLSSLERRLRYKPDRDELQRRFRLRAEEVAKEARLPGFRPGKVPRTLIEERYSDAILEDVHAQGKRDSLEFVRELEDYELWQIVQIFVDDPQNLASTEYVVDFVVKPELDLSELESLRLCEPNLDVETDTIEKIGLIYRYKNATGIEVDRPAQIGDRITIEVANLGSQLTGDLRKSQSQIEKEYFGRQVVVVEPRLYDIDQIGSLVHEELLNRAVGDEFEISKDIPKVPPSVLEKADEDLTEQDTPVPESDAEETDTEPPSESSETEDKPKPISIFSWVDFSRLPQRSLHVKISISKVEEISSNALNEDFFVREDVPYDNMSEMLDELESALNDYGEQIVLDAQASQLTSQICARNPVDLPYSVLLQLQPMSHVEDEWVELGATYVADSSVPDTSPFHLTYLRCLENFYIEQYAAHNDLEPSDEIVMHVVQTRYKELSEKGHDADRVFEQEYQANIRNHLRREMVFHHVFNREEVPNVTVEYRDFYLLARSGLWTLPPPGGPFTWSAPVSAYEIEQALKVETGNSEDSASAVEDEFDSTIDLKQNAAKKRKPGSGNWFTNLFKRKSKKTSSDHSLTHNTTQD